MQKFEDPQQAQSKQINVTIVVTLSEQDKSQQFSFEFLIDPEISFNLFFDQFKQDVLSERLQQNSNKIVCKLSGKEININETDSLEDLEIVNNSILYVEIKSPLCEINQLNSAFKLEVTVEYNVSQDNLFWINQYIENIKRSILNTGYQKVQNLEISVQLVDE